MARRAAYTKVKRTNFSNPAHVEGMGDKTFRGFQCLNKDCTRFLFIETETIDPDFEYTCDSCGFIHKAGESTKLYDYELEDKRDGSTIETNSFEILHDDYVRESKEFKYCIVCGTLKPFELFGKHSSHQTGRQGECRVCKQVYNGITPASLLRGSISGNSSVSGSTEKLKMVSETSKASCFGIGFISITA